jgi:hypothetical protein
VCPISRTESMSSKSLALVIVSLVWSIIVLSIDSGSCASPPVTIVEANQPKAVIVIPNNSTGQVRAAALLLSQYVHKATSAELAIVKEADAAARGAKVNIWVGQSDYVLRQNIKFKEMEVDGFSITFPDYRNVVIAGPSDWGTEFGVYEFLERFLGVRWLLPGAMGDHAHKIDTIQVQPHQVMQKPVFFSRLMSGIRGGEVQSAWARRNRMHGEIRFHHNLQYLFPPEKYKLIHPEFYPFRSGLRYLPSDDADYKWQPCFSAAGIVEEAIKNICDYFEKSPEATSYSLGMNDSGSFCQCDKCMAKVGSKKNFLDLPDYSDLYYDWANKVAEGVLKKYPDKWFGCLAYREVAEPPKAVKVNTRIVPFMTYDRMKWIDPVVQSQGKDLTERWAKQSPRIGWYDYIYGTPYLVPRVYFHKMAEYYRYGYEKGVRAMYAEAYPNWGEGPKLYLALKLQWDPYSDVDALLKEWYVAAVGDKAAADLAAYYDLWEDFWTNRIKDSKWFTRGGQYLAFDNAGYLDVVTYEDIEKSRRLLESTIEKTETPEQKERAQLILKAFEYYEASVVAYLGLVRKVTKPGKDKKYYEEMNQKRLQLVNEFENDPVLVHPLRFDQRPKLKF